MAFAYNANSQTVNTNQWTFIRGDSLLPRRGYYGAAKTPSDITTPGGRQGSVSWTDPSGNFWLFGGQGYDAEGDDRFRPLNDLWKYNASARQWTWIKGDSKGNASNAYGVQGISGLANKPGARMYSVSWTDPNGNLWLFGGYNNERHHYYNDFWKYSPSSGQWTWMKCDSVENVNGIYGIKGTFSVDNKPGARSNSVSWADKSGNLWLFGGSGSD